MTAVASAERADLGWSFIDLKSWALEAVADPPAGDPFIAGRRALHLGDGSVTAGALRLQPGFGQAQAAAGIVRVPGQAGEPFEHRLALRDRDPGPTVLDDDLRPLGGATRR